MPSLHTLSLSAFAARRLPDEDAFDRALRGDPVAFAEVYRRYQKRVYGFALARSLDPHAAADATQEVFVRLLHAPQDSMEPSRVALLGHSLGQRPDPQLLEIRYKQFREAS